MRRLCVSLICVMAVGCGTDSMPQLFNEAAQTKAEFVDRLMLVVDEDTASVHFERGKKQYEDRIKDVKERFDKLKKALEFESFEKAFKDTLTKKEQINSVGLLKKTYSDDWLGGMMLMRDSMEAENAYVVQEFYTDFRLRREQARLQSLERALGNAPKVSAVNQFLGTSTKWERFTLFGYMSPGVLFFTQKNNPALFKTPQDYAAVKLPPPPEYVPVGGKKTASLPDAFFDLPQGVSIEKGFEERSEEGSDLPAKKRMQGKDDRRNSS